MRGRRITVPRGAGVRPTSDRVRESLFMRLGDLEGLRVLDLYAGSGALGIEALSRGAREVLFVERAAPVAARLQENLEALDVASATRLWRTDAVRALRRLAAHGERFDLVLADPPYGLEEARRALRAAAAVGILARGGTLVVEASRRHPPGDVPGLEIVDERQYGDTRIVRYRTAPALEDAAARPEGPRRRGGRAAE